MSRSYRQPVMTCSGQIDKDKAHRQVRRAVRAELDKPEPDEYLIEFDTRDLGVEQWGTKFGYIFDDYGHPEEAKKLSRK